jgi:hypothetical protein
MKSKLFGLFLGGLVMMSAGVAWACTHPCFLDSFGKCWQAGGTEPCSPSGPFPSNPTTKLETTTAGNKADSWQAAPKAKAVAAAAPDQSVGGAVISKESYTIKFCSGNCTGECTRFVSTGSGLQLIDGTCNFYELSMCGCF